MKSGFYTPSIYSYNTPSIYSIYTPSIFPLYLYSYTPCLHKNILLLKGHRLLFTVRHTSAHIIICPFSVAWVGMLLTVG